jgi:hypothetical protein
MKKETEILPKRENGEIKSQHILKLQENSPIPSCASELEHHFHWFIFPLDTHWLAIWRLYDFLSHGAGFGGSLLMAYVRSVMYVGSLLPCIISLSLVCW